MRGYTEFCNECVEYKIAVAGYSGIDRPHPSIAGYSPVGYICPLSACGRTIELGFCQRTDLEAFKESIGKLANRGHHLHHAWEHIQVAFWHIFGGPVRALRDGSRRLDPLSAPRIARKMPRLRLTPRQVQLRLTALKAEIQGVRSVMEMGIILPDSDEERKDVYRRLWEDVIRRAASRGRMPTLQ